MPLTYIVFNHLMEAFEVSIIITFTLKNGETEA